MKPAALAWVAGGAAVLGLVWYVATRVATAYADGRPEGLVRLAVVDGVPVVASAAAAYQRMQAAAARAGVVLKLTSGFRTMARQTELYEQLQRGERTAAVARPGYSNHQRGRVDKARRRGPAIDIAVGGAGTETHRWMVGNASSYGFDSAEGNAVGEPWHWVYLGEAA